MQSKQDNIKDLEAFVRPLKLYSDEMYQRAFKSLQP
jgi:hypothetical protein